MNIVSWLCPLDVRKCCYLRGHLIGREDELIPCVSVLSDAWLIVQMILRMIDVHNDVFNYIEDISRSV